MNLHTISHKLRFGSLTILQVILVLLALPFVLILLPLAWLFLALEGIKNNDV